MPALRIPPLLNLLKLAAVVLIGKVLFSIVANYRNYLPPDFEADFLLGREPYFWQGYHWAFFLHIFAGPCALILGLLLISERFRRRYPKWHRRFGRTQAVITLGLIVPTGFGMAWYAANGPVAGVGFALLAVMTGLSVALGWRAAVRRKFDVHRRWMTRCFLCLCSTIVLRLNAGLGESLQIGDEWFYAQSAWTSWLIPLLTYEWLRRTKSQHRQRNPEQPLNLDVAHVSNV